MPASPRSGRLRVGAFYLRVRLERAGSASLRLDGFAPLHEVFLGAPLPRLRP